jgi:predicted nuclease of predicted toxin-antitoxin system
MRFLVDESTGPWVAQWLREHGYEVFSVFEQSRGIDDEEIIQKAFAENRILITNDKDFGDKIFRDQKPHKGVVLLRLADERSFVKIEVLERLLNSHMDKLENQFVVVTENAVRFAKIK